MGLQVVLDADLGDEVELGFEPLDVLLGVVEDRQQQVADQIFAEVKGLYAALDDGRLRKQAGRGATSSLMRPTAAPEAS